MLPGLSDNQGGRERPNDRPGDGAFRRDDRGFEGHIAQGPDGGRFGGGQPDFRNQGQGNLPGGADGSRQGQRPYGNFWQGGQQMQPPASDNQGQEQGQPDSSRQNGQQTQPPGFDSQSQGQPDSSQQNGQQTQPFPFPDSGNGRRM